ncbi:hypothetical protein GCM10009687_12480 [Asanoa iriomotensis]|uniref:Uncharacterized protein n=1 Tax=Asanoa iriomotensis TaxID=234613 RepID=A0ABQ4CCD4_9ACTN|nr:hypothetical protein Air01nite_62410 [Asanoa iriomotensis]
MVTPVPEIVNKPSSCRRRYSAGMAAENVSWYDVPGVQIFGAVIGTLVLVYAIRRIFK